MRVTTILLACALLLSVAAAAWAPPPEPPPHGTVDAVAFSSDGKHLAVAIRASAPGRKFTRAIRLWDLALGKEARDIPYEGGIVDHLSFSSDGKRLLSGGVDGLFRLWEAETGKEARRFELAPEAVPRAALSPDGKRLVTWSCKKRAPKVRLWDAGTGRLLRTFDGPRMNVQQIHVSPNGRDVLLDGAGVVWARLDTGNVLRVWDTVKDGWVRPSALSPDGRLLFLQQVERMGDPSKRMAYNVIWGLRADREVRRFQVGTNRSTPKELQDLAAGWAAFSPKGDAVLLADWGKRLRLLDAVGGKERWSAPAPPTHGSFPDCALVAGGRRVAALGWAWDALRCKMTLRFKLYAAASGAAVRAGKFEFSTLPPLTPPGAAS